MPGRANRTTCVVFGALMIALAVAHAQQPQQSGKPPADSQPDAQQPASPPPPPKPLIPIAASTLAATPDAYYGEPVSLAGAVDQSLSKTAFSVDQDKTKSTGKDVLVLAPKLQRPVTLNSYVTVIGEAVRFDPAALGDKLKSLNIDLAPEVAVKYAGKPAVIATSVIDATGADIARRLPPPMTAEEETYQKLMKQVGSVNGGLRKAIEASDVKLATEHAGTLKKTFVEVEAFWRTRRKRDASNWAQDARRLSENIERSAAAGRWDDVKNHATTLGKACQSCHGTYRDRFDDGSYRIKKEGTE